MKVNGVIIKLKAREYFGMLKEMSIWECSKMTWLMDLVSTLILMDLNTEESLEMISKKAMEKRNG